MLTWLQGVAWRTRETGVTRALLRSLGHSVIRLLVFSLVVLLGGLALFVTHPSFQGHGGGVRSVAFAPDGQRVLTGSSDGTARLWTVATGQELQRFEGHGGPVRSVVFAPDGHQVLTGSWDGTARMWTVSTGQEVQRFEGHGDPVQSVAFAPDGQQVLTGSEDRTARLWTASTGTVLWVSPRPFWDDRTWGWDALVVWFLLVVLFVLVPTTRLFDPGRVLHLRTPNPYLPLYTMPGVARWLPPEHLDDGVKGGDEH